jgi:hypothetical protein
MKFGRSHVCQVTEFDLDESQEAVSMEAALVLERDNRSPIQPS